MVTTKLGLDPPNHWQSREPSGTAFAPAASGRLHRAHVPWDPGPFGSSPPRPRQERPQLVSAVTRPAPGGLWIALAPRPCSSQQERHPISRVIPLRGDKTPYKNAAAPTVDDDVQGRLYLQVFADGLMIAGGAHGLTTDKPAGCVPRSPTTVPVRRSPGCSGRLRPADST